MFAYAVQLETGFGFRPAVFARALVVHLATNQPRLLLARAVDGEVRDDDAVFKLRKLVEVRIPAM